jgi:hypothetical protein
MQTTDAKRLCQATGLPAFAELRLGHGGAWTGSRHEGSLFVAIGSVNDGDYSDDLLDDLIGEGRVVVYGTAMDGLFPASEIGRAAACELFRLGAAEVAAAIDERRNLASVLSPLELSLGGQPVMEQGADFMSLGKLWALAEYARGVQPLRDLDPEQVASQVYGKLLVSETPAGYAAEASGLRQLH